MKTYIDDTLDHRHLNDVLGDDCVTAERIAKHLFDWCAAKWAETTAVRARQKPRKLAPSTGQLSYVPVEACAMTAGTIRVNEIFGPTIQGEGALIGQPTVFVRTGGCDYRCSWCDTLHAVDSAYRDDWHPMTPQAILMQVDILSGGKPLMVSLSGGNPAIQPLGPLDPSGPARTATGLRWKPRAASPRDWFGASRSADPQPEAAFQRNGDGLAKARRMRGGGGT